MNSQSNIVTLRKEKREFADLSYCYELSTENTEDFKKSNCFCISIELRCNGSKTTCFKKQKFKCEEKANEFFDMIVENLVTPLNLPYVIADEILNYI